MYYLLINDQQTGPYPEEDIQAMLTSGQITTETLAWKEGLDGWEPVSNLLAAPAAEAETEAPAPGASVIPTKRAGGGLGTVRRSTPTSSSPAKASRSSSSGSRSSRSSSSEEGGSTRRRRKRPGMLVMIGIAGGVLLLLSVGGAGGYYLYLRGQAKQESKALADEIVRTIATNWQPDDLVQRETPELQQNASTEKLKDSFAVLKEHLGPLKATGESMGASAVRYSLHSGWIGKAQYTSTATFENGDMEFTFILVWLHGEWKISGFGMQPHAKGAASSP